MNRKTKPKMIGMFVRIAVIMLVFGMLATSMAYAETPRDRFQNAQDKYQIYRDRISNAQDVYQESKERFQVARDKFNDARTQRNTEELRKATRNYLNHTIDYTIKRLEALKNRASEAEENGYAPFEITDNIDDYISQLEDLRDDAAAAQTREEFQAVIKEIRNIWQHVHLESRYFIMGTMNNRIDNFLERSESISERISAEIEKLKEAGEDTERLEALLDEYNEALEEARASKEAADELFAQHGGFDDAGVLQDPGEARKLRTEGGQRLRETHRELREANSILRQIFMELKRHRHGAVNLRGTGVLTASGNGTATLSGNLSIEVSAWSGVLTIMDYGGDAEIEVTGLGTRVVLGDGTIKYNGFNGTATISGSSITVVINGNDIELTAEGTGSAILRGHGTYTVEPTDGDTVEGEWAPSGGNVV